MPSLDIVSRINFTELDNAINNTQKAIATRFDFRNSKVEITVNQKDKKINMYADDEGKMKSVYDMFTAAAIKRGIPLKAFEFGEIEPGRHGALGNVKREIKLKEGLTSDLAKQIWNVEETIAYLSGLVELKPGDLIFTGTPSGVAAVRRGDRMTGTIAGLGKLEVEVV